jgi:anti-sigma regulatory factor (Ser/Thr protein kinase)
VELSGDRLTVSITDDGIPFNPFGVETPDTKLSLEERKIGGLGVHLVRKVMDKAIYQRRVDKNVVTLVKELVTDTHENQ